MTEEIYIGKTGLGKLWELITNKLSGKADSTHTHTKSEITDFPASLKNPYALTVKFNGVTAKTYNGASAQTVDVSPANIGAAEEAHEHAVADITGLQTALNGKAASSHTHAITDVTGLQSALDGILPSVTSTDNGKFLRVVDGAWAAVAITDADGVSY